MRAAFRGIRRGGLQNAYQGLRRAVLTRQKGFR